MDFFEAVAARYSERSGFTGEIPREDLEKILSAGVAAPSGCNIKPIDFVVVLDEDRKKEISEVLGKNYLSNAPALVFIVADTDTEYYVEDASAAMENILLASAALGYASCWIQPRVQRNQEKIRGILDIPKEKFVFAVTPIGKPAGVGKQGCKKELGDAAHFDGW